MRNRKRMISIVAGILAAVMLLSLIAGVLPTLVGAEEQQSSDEIKEQIEALEEEKAQIDAEIESLKDQIDDNLTGMELVVAQRQAIDQEIFMLYEKADLINEQIIAYTQLIADKQEELEEAEAQLEQLRQRHQERLRTMEEEGDMSYWTVIFEADSFSDLLDRFAMVQDLQEADQKRLEEMSKAAQTVATAKESLETEKASLETMKEELTASQTELEAKRTESEELLEELLSYGEEFEALLDKAEQATEDLMNKIDEKEDEYDAALESEEESRYQEWLATSIPPTTAKPSYSGGGTAGSPNTVGDITWLIPCNYTRFSSPYGYRIHPVYGDWRFHSGVDLAAASGTPIIATRAGKVKTATYDWSSGYYVTVDHMDGFESKYLHMTHYIVEEGEYVNAGQVIGYVGSTGTSTGPHLHFGIYYNGSSVNPANYINIT